MSRVWIKWTAAEDRALCEHYPAGGVEACRPHIPARSDAAINCRASNIGIAYLRNWTTVEDRVIRRRYTDGGVAACIPLLPRHSRRAIFERARHLGVQRAPRWSAGHRQILAKIYPTAGAAAVSPLVNRSKSAIQGAAQRAKIKSTKSKRHSIAAYKALRKLYPSGGVNSVARHPSFKGRTRGAIRQLARRLGVHYNKEAGNA